MNERLSTWFPLLLLAALAALTYWLERAIQGPAATRDALTRHDPDYIVDKLLGTRMDIEGKIKNTLHAVRMVHYPDDDSTELESPRFMSYGQRSPLTITAKQGQVSSNGENVYFMNDVKVVRAPFGEKSELVVNTEYLHILPDDNIAKTDRPAVITDANMRVNTSGFELNSETRTLKMHSQVRGTFYDSKSSPRTP